MFSVPFSGMCRSIHVEKLCMYVADLYPRFPNGTESRIFHVTLHCVIKVADKMHSFLPFVINLPSNISLPAALPTSRSNNDLRVV